MEFNVLAAVVAGVVGLFSGGLWYGKPLFGALWSRENARGRTPEDCQPHPARVFAVSIGFSIVAACAFAWWLGPQPSLAAALKQAALVGLAFVGTSFGVNYQFANRSLLMWAIDAGYHTVQFLLFALVLGLWP